MPAEELNPDQMLRQALPKARKLVAELESKAAELEALPPKHFSAEKLAEGRMVMQKAVESARKMLASLEAAERLKP